MDNALVELQTAGEKIERDNLFIHDVNSLKKLIDPHDQLPKMNDVLSAKKFIMDYNDDIEKVIDSESLADSEMYHHYLLQNVQKRIQTDTQEESRFIEQVNSTLVTYNETSDATQQIPEVHSVTEARSVLTSINDSLSESGHSLKLSVENQLNMAQKLGSQSIDIDKQITANLQEAKTAIKEMNQNHQFITLPDQLANAKALMNVEKVLVHVHGFVEGKKDDEDKKDELVSETQTAFLADNVGEDVQLGRAQQPIGKLIDETRNYFMEKADWCLMIDSQHLNSLTDKLLGLKESLNNVSEHESIAKAIAEDFDEVMKEIDDPEIKADIYDHLVEIPSLKDKLASPDASYSPSLK